MRRRKGIGSDLNGTTVFRAKDLRQNHPIGGCAHLGPPNHSSDMCMAPRLLWRFPRRGTGAVGGEAPLAIGDGRVKLILFSGASLT